VARVFRGAGAYCGVGYAHVMTTRYRVGKHHEKGCSKEDELNVGFWLHVSVCDQKQPLGDSLQSAVHDHSLTRQCV